MIKPLLRSGYRDDYLARGDSGRKVFDSALQIIETLRLRQQQTILRHLAIPQVNTTNKRIDWYAPEHGEVVSWSAASEEQQQGALRQLENCQKELAILNRKSQESSNKAAQLFTALLSQILHFPSPNHIYLVNNLPVITFWGFTRPEDIHEAEILEQLHTTLRTEQPAAAIEIEEIKQEPEVQVEPTPEPIPQPEEPIHIPTPPPVQEEPQPVQTTVEVAEKPEVAPASGSRRRYMLFAMAFVCAAIVASPYIFNATQSALVPTAPDAPVVVKKTVVKKAAVTPPFVETLPLQRAQVVKPPAPVTPVAVTVEKDMLVLPENSVRAGSIRFLNGSWRVKPAAHAPAAEDFPILNYAIHNDKGKATAVYHKNTCTATLKLGLMPSGNLSIKYQSRAKCNDGSRISLPEIICRQGLSGPAECSGLIADKADMPLNFRKVKG